MTIIEDRHKEYNFTNEDFYKLATLANQKTGIVIAENKRDMLYSRLSRRIRTLGLKDFQEYSNMLHGPAGDSEIIQFINAITTNLTKFFREIHHFDNLRDYLAPYRSENKSVKIWSAGCSSGEEPYSIAMTAASLSSGGVWDLKILATDIDTGILDKATAGEYDSSAIELIPEQYKRYMKKIHGANNMYVVDDNVKSMIRFKRLNLMEKWPMRGGFDVIFCRNVVIYFDKGTQSRIFDRYAEMLKPHGRLYIGHSENLYKVCDRFKLIDKTTYERIK
jgi:chemotaxis protein methyltransferase CheR